MASEMRQNIAALGLLDRSMHLLLSVLKPHMTSDLARTKQQPDYILSICDSTGQALGLLYKGGVGVVELDGKKCLPEHSRVLLLLALIGLGVR